MGFIKIGDYGQDLRWRDIRMHTEHSVQKARDIKVEIMFPIWRGTFNLSNHDYHEPINITVQYASEYQVNLVTL